MDTEIKYLISITFISLGSTFFVNILENKGDFKNANRINIISNVSSATIIIMLVSTVLDMCKSIFYI